SDDIVTIEDGVVFRIRGGRGYDTVELASGVALAVEPAEPRVRGIERIRLAADGTASLTMSEPGLRRLSPSTNTLVVEGSGGQLTLTSGEWTGPQQEGDAWVYRSQVSDALLRVSTGIEVTLP
nr:hypothetical protein [Deltaproteobacteria bacterium]